MSGSPAIAPTKDSQPPSKMKSRRFRVIASVLIIGHVWAVVGRPIEFATQGPFGTSPSATLFRSPVRAYSQFAYLDHGYAFFAPDPGPSHLIGASVTARSGETSELMYPDLGNQWPRLMYHRHFMLAEFLNNVYHPPGEPPANIADNPSAAHEWHMARRRYESVRDSIIGCLKRQHPECDVAIRRLEHRQPGLPEYFDEKIGLDDQRLVTTLLDEIEALDAQDTQPPTTLQPTTPQIGILPGQLPIVPRSRVPRSSSIEEIRPIREEASTENPVGATSPAIGAATEAN